MLMLAVRIVRGFVRLSSEPQSNILSSITSTDIEQDLRSKMFNMLFPGFPI